MAEANIFHPWEGYVEPFQIWGNLYFVGTVPASTHLIDTGEGLIVIDPGFPQSLYLVIENIHRLGFKVKDIKYIICTHGGVGRNSMRREFLEQYGLGFEIREKFISAIDSMIEEKVDILLGNHVANNDTLGKKARMTDNDNPFIDPNAWKKFLVSVKEKYFKMIEEEENETRRD